MWAWRNQKMAKICRTNRLHFANFQLTTRSTRVRQSPPASYTCGKLPGTLALLGSMRPCTIKPFLPPFLSWRHSCEKRYQALSRFSILQATESWAGPWNEATSKDFLLALGKSLLILLKWAWASPTLMGLHLKRCVYAYVCTCGHIPKI